MKAKLAFFYGFSFSEIETMPIVDANMFYRAITVIEAQEMMKQVQVSSFPKMKKESQEKLHRALHKQAYPEAYSTQKAVSSEDMAKMLSRMI